MSNVRLAIVSEPDPRIRHVLRIELSNADWTVLVAADGEEVERLAANAPADLIVLDVSTTRLRSYSACARIRRQSGYESRPIILTASTVGARDAVAASTAGATALLAKPYSMSKLFEMIRPSLAANDPRRDTFAGPQDRGLDWAAAAKWSFGAGSGLRQGSQPIPVTAGPTTRIPLIRLT